MKIKNANDTRELWTGRLMTFVDSNLGEDVGLIASNSFNFPVVANGEEGWVEITIKVPKDDDGYEKREGYEIKERLKAEKKTADLIAKEKKIKRDIAAREAKAGN